MGKFSSILLSLTTTISLSGVMGLVPVVHAQTGIADLQAKIAELMAQLSALQAAQSGVPAAALLTRDLTVGSRGDDVMALQKALNARGFTIAASGLGSPGNETSYFGGLTRAAVAKYQAANGISPAVGYVGPKTRASMNALVGVTPSVTPGIPTPGVVVPGSGLSVSLAANNPPATSMIAGSSRIAMLAINVTASAVAPVTINNLRVTKLGVMSDSNISAAYLTESGSVVAQYSAISKGVIEFSGANIVVNAGQTRNLVFQFDLSSSATAGNSIGFGIASAANVLTVGNVPVSGLFAINGNIMTATTVSNPSLAELTVASASVGTTVYAGTQNVLVSQWTLTGTNNAMTLNSIKFNVTGSAAKSDLKNVKLFVNGTQYGAALPSVATGGVAFFDLSAAPPTINTGSNNLQLYADVMGSPSYDFRFQIFNTFDVLAVDTQYMTGVSVTVNGSSGVSITINQGQITVTASGDTPSGTISTNSSGVQMAKFVIYAAGEPVEVRWLDFRLAMTGTTGTLSNIFRNISIVDDAGLQIGTTISSPPRASTTCTGSAAAAGYNAAGTNYDDCFGTSGSPISYIVPANTSRTLTLLANIQSTAAFTTVTGSLTSETGGNLRGLTSRQTSNSGAASGAARSLVTTPLSSAINGAFGNPRYAAGATGVRIGSYVLSASSAEGVNITTITTEFSAAATSSQNVMLKVGGTQFGTTRATMSGSDIVTFSGASPLNVPRGGSVILDVYADILSNAGSATYTDLTQLDSCSGIGATTNASVSCSPTNVNGQDPVVTTGPTLLVTADQTTQLASQVVMGATGLSLATLKFTDTGNIEPIKITVLTLSDLVSSTTTVRQSFNNLTLWQGNTQVGGPVSLTDGTGIAAATYRADFNFATPLVVPQNGTLVLQLKGDVASTNSSGSTDNSAHNFRVNAAAQVTAIGQYSNSSATVTVTSAAGNDQTVLNTKLTVSGAALGSATSRTRSATDDVATLTFTADANDDVVLNTVTLRLQGVAVSNGTAVSGIQLLKGGSAWNNLPTQTCTTGAGNSCSITFLFAPMGNSTTTIVSRGTSQTVTLRVDSSNFFNGANTSDSMSVLITATGSVDWGDKGAANVANTTTRGLNLEAKVVPLSVSTVSYE